MGWSNSNPFELVKKVFDKLSNETRFVGLSFEKAAARRSALAYARTFASRKVFLPTYTPPAKMFFTLFALRAQTLRGFFDRLKRVGAIPTRFKSLWKTYFCSDQMREE